MKVRGYIRTLKIILNAELTKQLIASFWWHKKLLTFKNEDDVELQQKMLSTTTGSALQDPDAENEVGEIGVPEAEDSAKTAGIVIGVLLAVGVFALVVVGVYIKFFKNRAKVANSGMYD